MCFESNYAYVKQVVVYPCIPAAQKMTPVLSTLLKMKGLSLMQPLGATVETSSTIVHLRSVQNGKQSAKPAYGCLGRLVIRVVASLGDAGI